MIKYFDKEEVVKSKKQRKNLLIIFFGVLALYLASLVAFLVTVYNTPYGGDTALLKIEEYSLTAIFVIFCFIFLGIPFRRVNKYVRFVVNLDTGIKETSEAVFLCYDEALHDKDGVDCKALVFLEWNKYKKDYFERKVLVFYEKNFPEITEQAEVRFITQGNFLIEYEITGDISDAEKEKYESDNNGNR